MDTLSAAWTLLLTADAELMGIIGLSLRVSLTATLIATLIGAPIGAALAIWRFPGRRLVLLLASTLMALPPVVAGLFVYLALSRAGPLGELGLLFTPAAMIVAQSILILPIIIALVHAAIQPMQREYDDMLTSVAAGPWLRVRTLMWDARFVLVTAVLAGFGRAIAEVGAVLIVGGNIAGVTRVMTTTIALETSKGNLELALALGLILMFIAFAVNVVMQGLTRFGRQYEVA
ncbi:ABC transporter permease [Oceanibium sediminis]|uniref:ABC transporter permease n=1 Tax=Oceanibium sediminis TaxID=2026339 RepID=UPI000DD43062|nr:ABC transporter permease [Oceanibium sediminis]